MRPESAAPSAPPPAPSGSVLIALHDESALLWLVGDVDDAVAPDLDAVAEHVPDLVARVTIDASAVTFCDRTLLRFIASIANRMPVTVRNPSRTLIHILAFSGLIHVVSIVATARPGPDLRRPAPATAARVPQSR